MSEVTIEVIILDNFINNKGVPFQEEVDVSHKNIPPIQSRGWGKPVRKTTNNQRMKSDYGFLQIINYLL